MIVISGTGLGPAQLGGTARTGAGTISTQYTTNTLIAVKVNGVAAPLTYASSTAVAAMVPYQTTGSTAKVTVTYQGTTSTAFFAVKVAASAPGVFTANASGQGQAAVVKHHRSFRDWGRADIREGWTERSLGPRILHRFFP